MGGQRHLRYEGWADPRLETTVSGRAVVAFEFADGSFAARPGGRLWIAKDAIVQ